MSLEPSKCCFIKEQAFCDTYHNVLNCLQKTITHLLDFNLKNTNKIEQQNSLHTFNSIRNLSELNSVKKSTNIF